MGNNTTYIKRLIKRLKQKKIAIWINKSYSQNNTTYIKRLKQKKIAIIILAILLNITIIIITILKYMNIIPTKILLTIPVIILIIYKMGKDVDNIILHIQLWEYIDNKPENN